MLFDLLLVVVWAGGAEYCNETLGWSKWKAVFWPYSIGRAIAQWATS